MISRVSAKELKNKLTDSVWGSPLALEFDLNPTVKGKAASVCSFIPDNAEAMANMFETDNAIARVRSLTKNL